MDILNKINEVGTDALNRGIRFAGDAVAAAGPAVKKAVVDAVNNTTQYIKEIPEKGAIPILPTAVHPVARTVAGYGKSLAGPLGKPYRILDNNESNEFYQKTVDAADFNPKTNKVTFNQNIKDKKAYDELGQNLSNKDVGRYVGTVLDDGTVITEDNYDTNRDVDWHMHRVLKGTKNAEDNTPIGIVDRGISAASALHRRLDDIGWTNDRPFGTTVKMGELKQNP